MARAIWLWMRRSSAFVAWPGMLGLVLAATWSRTGWQFEFDWAMSWTAGTTVLLAPLLAGLVAHDRARRHAPTLVLVEGTSSRGLRAALALPLAATLLASGAWLLAAGVVMAWVWRHDAVGSPDLAYVAEVVAVLLAAACLGAAVGTWIRSRAAGPVAALTVYSLFILAPHVELGGLMSSGGSIGTLVGLRRNPGWTAGVLALHLAVASARVLVLAARRAITRPGRVSASAAAVAVLVAGAFGFHAAKAGGPYVEHPVATICLGTAPEVCGPEVAEPMLAIAETGLAQVYDELDGSGLPLRERYVLARGLAEGAFPADAGDLTLDSSTFDGGRYSEGDALMTLVVPTLCQAYFDDEPPADLMKAQTTVMRWLDERLGGDDRGPAPPGVVDAYDRLRGCEPHRGSIG